MTMLMAVAVAFAAFWCWMFASARRAGLTREDLEGDDDVSGWGTG